MMTSIRTFLIAVTLSVVCLSNFIAAFQGYRHSLSAVDRIEEKQLVDKANIIKALFEKQQIIPTTIFDDDTIFQVWHKKTLLAKSSNAPDSLFYFPESGFHLKSYDGHQWLLYGYGEFDDDFYIITATQHRAYSSLTEEVLIRAILPIIWVLPIIGLLVWGIVHIGTKPLKQLANNLSGKAVNDFSPLKNGRYAEELVPIVSALNGLLGRLADAFARERRFSADAAHELRTPLSALKVNLHNLTKDEKNKPTLQALKRTADRMEHSIKQLLSLHRVSLDVDGDGWSVIDLHTVAQEVIADVYDHLVLKKQNIELVGGNVEIKGCFSSIAVLLRNLLDNASKYTPDQGIIRVTVSQQYECAFLLVEDSGPGIPDSEYGRVLERFYRVGGDRNDSKVVGSGLGLSIVADIARTHSGQMHLSRSLALGGLAVNVSFPLAEGILSE